MKKINLAMTYMLLMSILLMTACSQETLSGEVIVLSEEMSIGDSIPLMLKVSLDQEDIHDVMWDIRNEEGESLLGTDQLAEGQQVLDLLGVDEFQEVYGDQGENIDRVAYWVPEMTGSYTVEVSGFMNQTNPQPITEIVLVIK